MAKENIKISVYGLKLNKTQFLIIYGVFTLGLIYWTVAAFLYDGPTTPEDTSSWWVNFYYKYSYSKAAIIFCWFWLVIEAQLFWLLFSKKQLKIIGQQKSEIENQKDEIEAQRDELERQRNIAIEQRNQISQQQKEIIDSINYASNIQFAMLPSDECLKNNLTGHFILFIPRDIVSGDFYWAIQKNNHLIIAAVDCTGHGVPGALMSMLGITFLREITAKIETISAAEILNRLRSEIIHALQQTGGDGETRDGMDMALCAINLETNELQFSGANNPLYLIAKNTGNLSAPTLVEIKPDKMPIGVHDKKHIPFVNHIVQLEKGDSIYIFSDGYADQLGGEKGKKFKYKQLKELLLKIQEHPMNEQKKILKDTFDGWKGDMFQVDDIVMIGVKI